MRPVMVVGVTVIGRLRKDAALYDLPPSLRRGQQRGRGRPRKYGKNRISLAKHAGHKQAAVLRWEYMGGRLVGRVLPTGWVNPLESADCATLGAAVSGLFQRAGVDEADGPLPLTVAPPFTWTEWVRLWQFGGDEFGSAARTA